MASISSLQLWGLGSLRSLFLQNNDITRIDGLAGLFNLQVEGGDGREGNVEWGMGNAGGGKPQQALRQRCCFCLLLLLLRILLPSHVKHTVSLVSCQNHIVVISNSFWVLFVFFESVQKDPKRKAACGM